MPVQTARNALIVVGASRAARYIGLAALTLVLSCKNLQNAIADGDTRTISFHHIHTGENLTVTYKRNGQYDQGALKQINHLMRDWRRNEEIPIDPRVIDIIWEVNREVGGKEPIQVICGYRAPATNAMLRRRSKGVAQFSLHTLGKAIDFYIPGVPLEVQREAGLRLQRGGVGYYPGGAGQFVHMDTGSVRHWPRLSPEQYARIIAKRPTTVASRSEESEPVRKSLLASLFGADKETANPASPNRSLAGTVSDRPPSAPMVRPTSDAVPLPVARPTRTSPFSLADGETPRPPERMPMPASDRPPSATQVIATRGFWDAPAAEPAQAAILAGAVLTRERSQIFAPETTSTISGARPDIDRVPGELALAYAAEAAPSHAPLASRTQPMGTSVPHSVSATRLERSAAVASTEKPVRAVSTGRSGDRPALYPRSPTPASHEPWLRALVLAPDLQNFMTTTPFDGPDLQQLRALMQKPEAAIMMTFSHDPYFGMTTDHFSGSAFASVSTVTFARRTALLQ